MLSLEIANAKIQEIADGNINDIDVAKEIQEMLSDAIWQEDCVGI